MTTTKEDQMRAEFESNWGLIFHVSDSLHSMKRCAESGKYVRLHVQAAWDCIKASAESYEKKLTDCVAATASIHNLHVALEKSYAQKLSEANARNAMLVETLSEISCLTQSDKLLWWQILAREAISANSESVAAWEADRLREDRLYLARCFREHDRGVLASAEQIAQMLEGMANDVTKG